MYQSQKAYDPRAFELFWTPFVRVFQALCVSNHSIFHAKHHIWRLTFFIIFSASHISLMFYTLINGLHIKMRPQGKYKTSSLMFYVNMVSVSGNFLTHFVAHLEPLFTKKYEEEIFRKLNEINGIFALKLDYVTDFHTTRKQYIRHTCVFFIIASAISFGYSFYSLPDDNFGTFVFVVNRLIAVIIIRARRCYMAFQVNTVSNILMNLQILLKRQQQTYRPGSVDVSPNYSERIRYLRDIYSNVWVLRNLLSSCFGWSFITFLMEFSFDLINSSYWAYVNIKIYESTNMIIQIACYILSATLNFWYICMICERCEKMGRGISKALHIQSNYQDRDYQRFIRIFSLQLRKQPIDIQMKQLFTFNYALLKSAIVLISTYVAIVIQFQISEENVPSYLKMGNK